MTAGNGVRYGGVGGLHLFSQVQIGAAQATWSQQVIEFTGFRCPAHGATKRALCRSTSCQLYRARRIARCRKEPCVRWAKPMSLCCRVCSKGL